MVEARRTDQESRLPEGLLEELADRPHDAVRPAEVARVRHQLVVDARVWDDREVVCEVARQLLLLS